MAPEFATQRCKLPFVGLQPDVRQGRRLAEILSYRQQNSKVSASFGEFSGKIGKFGMFCIECALSLIKISGKSQKRIVVGFFFIFYRFPNTYEN